MLSSCFEHTSVIGAVLPCSGQVLCGTEELAAWGRTRVYNIKTLITGSLFDGGDILDFTKLLYLLSCLLISFDLFMYHSFFYFQSYSHEATESEFMSLFFPI